MSAAQYNIDCYLLTAIFHLFHFCFFLFCFLPLCRFQHNVCPSSFGYWLYNHPDSDSKHGILFN